MKYPVLTATFTMVVSLLLSSCQESTASNESEQTVRTVRLVTAGENMLPAQRRFIGRIDALSTVDLAFQVAGRIEVMEVRHGSVVPQGELLAALDDTDYELALRDAQIALDITEIEYQREKQMLARGATPQAAYDRAKAERETRRLAVDRARRDLQYTRIEAPFDALISNRLVDAHTQIQAGTPVVRVQDVTELRVHISVPEDMMYLLGSIERITATAELLALPGQVFHLEYREHGTQTDSATQTYLISFGLPRKSAAILLPGMSATVTLSMEQDLGGIDIDLPVAALDASESTGFRVWVYDPHNGTVHAREVTAGSLSGDRVRIESGLQAGEQVVAAGASLVHEGMRVVPYAAD